MYCETEIPDMCIEVTGFSEEKICTTFNVYTDELKCECKRAKKWNKPFGCYVNEPDIKDACVHIKMLAIVMRCEYAIEDGINNPNAPNEICISTLSGGLFNEISEAVIDKLKEVSKALKESIHTDADGDTCDGRVYFKGVIRKYTVKRINKFWSCTCKDYKSSGDCEHIINEKNKQNKIECRRTLGIELAMKWCGEHNMVIEKK